MKTPEIQNPYLNSRRKWDEILGSYIYAKDGWRLMAIVEGVAILALIGGLIAVSMQTKVVPYLVEFNEHAEPVRVTRADVLAEPTANQTRAALATYVKGSRTVFGDRRAQQVMIDGVYAMTLPDSPAYQAMAEFHRENNPYERSGKEAVEVAINTVSRISDDTWQVEWTETTRQLSGRVNDSKVWYGAYTVVVVPPTDEKQIFVNPAGIYVKQFTSSPRLQ
jgi:type IV secretion system protein VirB5